MSKMNAMAANKLDTFFISALVLWMIDPHLVVSLFADELHARIKDVLELMFIPHECQIRPIGLSVQIIGFLFFRFLLLKRYLRDLARFDVVPIRLQ